MVQSSKTFRIFVSSTFSDLKEERNALQREVFPRLLELCAQHGFRFQAIDLRWGVSEEAGLDQQTMKICLEEIERSQRVSPKPNFIVLLGDRYGWKPLPYEIPADEFEEIKKVISPEDEDLLFWEGDELDDEELKKREGWYCKDENAVPPVYCLKPRSVDYPDNTPDEEIINAKEKEADDWYRIENKLKSILLDAIDKLGWTEDDPRRFKYESSATEQEIIQGVLNPPDFLPTPEEHVFAFFRNMEKTDNISCNDASKDYLDFKEDGTPDGSSMNRLESLKEKISNKLPPTNVFNYKTNWEDNKTSINHLDDLCHDVYNSLENILIEQIKEFEEKDALDQEIEAHKEFGKDRSRLFIGREENRNRIKSYLDDPNSKPMIVYGDSGSGKSALMAKAVEDLNPNFYQKEELYDDGIIVRFIGATPESSDIRSLVESLCQGITKTYDADASSIPSKYNELINDFKERLNFANPEKPLFIFLDALDQLSDSKKAYNLTWIPDELPENVHIVISILKEPFKSSIENRIPAENTNEVKPLEENEGQLILESWLTDETVGRKLTETQENQVINKFNINGLPLFLKLAFKEAKRWKSYTPTPILESDTPGIIRQMFERLSKPENHGKILVSHSLGYLSAAKNGLTEDEMLDILALDEDVFSLTKKFHEPTEDKLPVVLWSRLYFDLEPYLTERSADGTSLLAFYHRQLGEVAREEFLNENVKKSRHQLIADYFKDQNLSFDKDDEKVYNIRKVSELPYQQTYAESWKHLEEALCDLRFVEAKCAVGMTYDLIDDYNLALDMHPDAQKEKKKRLEHEKRLNKYVEDLIAYSEGKIEHLDIIPSVNPWNEDEIRKDTERIINNSNPLDRIKAFSQFVYSESHALTEFGYLPGFCLQQAYNSSNSGPLTQNARKNIKKSHEPLILRKNCLPDYNPYPAQLKTFEGVGKVWDVAITLDGKKVISGSEDGKVRLWDLETGKCLKTLEGHMGYVKSVAVTANSKKAISGSEDGKVRLWDLETGKCLKTLEGHTGPVDAVAVTPDGKKAISGSWDMTMRLWDLETGKCLKTLESHSGHVNVVAVTPDGKIAVSGSEYPDMTLRLWNLEKGELLKIVEGPREWVKSLAVTADGKKAVLGVDSYVVKVLDLQNGKELRSLSHTSKVWAVAVTPDGKNAISGSEDGNINLWDLKNGKILKTLKAHIGKIITLDITADGKIAVSGSVYPDTTLRLWNLETGKSLKMHQEYSSYINEIAVINNEKKAVISIYEEKAVHLWDIKIGKLLEMLENPNEVSSSCLTVTPDGRRVISGARWGQLVSLWDLKTGEHLKALICSSGTTDMVVDVTLDGKTIVFGNWSNLGLWDLETKEPLKTLQGHNYRVNTLAITPDGKRVLLGNNDHNAMILLNLETGKLEKTLEGHQSDVIKVVITPNNKRAISISRDKTVRLWDLKTGKCIKTWECGKIEINTLVITPDGKKVILGSRNGNILLWDLENGKMISISKEESEIMALSMTTDYDILFSNRKGNIILSHLTNICWDLPIITAKRIWLYGKKGSAGRWDDYIKAECSYCGNHFKVTDNIINTIREIEKQYKEPEGWISDEAWEDLRLVSKCPSCNNKIRFNPFIVDKMKKFRLKFW